jgi:hypothetical protein
VDVEKYRTLNSDLGIDIHQVKNFTINVGEPESDDILYLDGNFFIFPDSDKFYYHLIRDYVAQFEVLKPLVTDLTPLSLCDCNLDKLATTKNSCVVSNPVYGPHSHIWNRYKDVLTKVDILKYKQIKISNIFFIYTYPTLLTKNAVGYRYDDVLFDNIRRDWVEEQYSKVLRNIYSSYLRATNPDNKIYVSRYKESKEVHDLMTAVETYNKTKSLPENRKLQNEVLSIASGLPETLVEYEMKMSRAFSPEDELLLESYFLDKGYKVISPGDYSVEEQISMFTSSSVVAGAGGSGLTNLLFCNSDTKVVLITAGNLFGYGGHNRSALANNKKVEFFPERIHYNHETRSPFIKFSAAEMIELMDESGVVP